MKLWIVNVVPLFGWSLCCTMDNSLKPGASVKTGHLIVGGGVRGCSGELL